MPKVDGSFLAISVLLVSVLLTYLLVPVCVYAYMCVRIVMYAYRIMSRMRTGLLFFTYLYLLTYLHEHRRNLFSVTTTIQYGWSGVFGCVTPPLDVSVRGLSYVGDY